MKEWRHKTAHGNCIRIRWTPTGLQADHGDGWEIHARETEYSEEYCAGNSTLKSKKGASARAVPLGCGWPHAQFVQPLPEWWPGRKGPV